MKIARLRPMKSQEKIIPIKVEYSCLPSNVIRLLGFIEKISKERNLRKRGCIFFFQKLNYVNRFDLNLTILVGFKQNR